ncbi:MAG: YihY/virulence factor BrkB family protein [Bacteroidales bacterium]|nr:YihY/virulence factor BrkB family protein [Bacteroidales bacterium]
MKEKISNILRRITNWTVVRNIVLWSRKIIIPGFGRMPLYDVTAFFIKGISKGSITSRASSIAFNFFLAIFPMIIVFFTMIPFIPIAGFQETLLEIIQSVIPDGTEIFIMDTIIDIVERPRGGLLSITFILALFFATNGFDSIIESFNSTYHTFESRSWIRQKLISTLLFMIISFILILAITLITTGSAILGFLLEKEILGNTISYYLLESSRWLITVAICFFSISFIYYLGPTRKSEFRFISAGSTLATVLSLGASIGFNYYVQNFSSYNALYGSIGTLLIILIWIYFNALILLVGFELNASIHSARQNSDKSKRIQRQKKASHAHDTG